MQNKIVKSFLDSAVGPLLALIVAYAVFAALSPDTFLSIRMVELIFRQTAIVGCAALGMTLVIVAGGIDLSVGSVVALVAVVIAILLNHGWNPLLAAIAAILVGAAVGVVNGLLVTTLKIAPFMVTLCTLGLVRGFALALSNEQKVNTIRTPLNSLLTTLAPGDRWQVFPAGVWVFIALAVIATFALKGRQWGLNVFYVGSNPVASHANGIPVNKVLISVYALSALLAGVGGLLEFSRLTVGDPVVAQGLELEAIAAVVIGGGSLSGGRGSIPLTIVGALLTGTIRAGCTQLDFKSWVQMVITMTVILVAVAIDAFRRRRAGAAA